MLVWELRKGYEIVQHCTKSPDIWGETSVRKVGGGQCSRLQAVERSFSEKQLE